MNKDKKCVFVGFGLDPTLVSKFRMILSKTIKGQVHVKNVKNHFMIYVSTSQYEEALIKGMDIASRMHLPLKWVDFYNNYMPLHYMSVLYGVLPPTRQDMVFENFASADPLHPYDITKYITDLQKFLGGNTIMIQYKPNCNAVELLVEVDFSSYDSILEKCRFFDSKLVSKPFETYFTEWNGKLLEYEKLKEVFSPMEKKYY